MPQSVLEMAKDLVLAQVRARRVPVEDIPKALQAAYVSLMALRAQEEGGLRPVGGGETERPAADWRSSIGRRAIACLECGAPFKQLSGRHLKEHGLDASSYRAKHGIPRTQPLSARALTALRKKIAQQTRPWEKAPAYLKGQERKESQETLTRQAPEAAPPKKVRGRRAKKQEAPGG